MKEKHPDLQIWRHDVFTGETYQAFERRVRSALPNDNGGSMLSSSLEVERVLPQMNNIIRTGFQAMLTQMRALKSDIGQSKEEMELMNSTMAAIFQQGAELLNHNHGGGSSSSVPARENGGGSSPLLMAGPIEEEVGAVPIYKLSRRIKSVMDVWKEYKVGLFGGPAVEQLEMTYGTAWRKDRTESRFFCRRKKIYDEVQKVSREKNIPLAQAVESVEEQRLHYKLSLDGLQKFI